jgi:hypothetical protein
MQLSHFVNPQRAEREREQLLVERERERKQLLVEKEREREREQVNNYW